MSVAALTTLILLVLLYTPLALFLMYGWRARRRQIIELFPEQAVSLYYRQYFPAPEGGRVAGKALGQLTRQDFIDDFDTRYGRWKYAIPALLLLCVSAFTLFCSVNAVTRLTAGAASADGPLAELRLPLLAVISVAGAYVWVVYDFIYRERTLDFSTTHVNWASFRLAVAVPLAFVVPQLFGAQLSFAVAFLLGVFPAATLMRIVRRQAAQKIGFEDAQQDLSTKLEKLPSIDSGTADRFRDEGITTVAQLGNTDPISLTIRSGYCFSFILDCISESLAWYYLGADGIVATRDCSVPGALEVYGLIEELDYQDDPTNPDDDREREDRRLAAVTLRTIADKMNQPQPVVERMMRCIRDDSRVEFLAWLADAINEKRAAVPPAPRPPAGADGAVVRVARAR